MAEDALVAHYRSLKPWRFFEVERFELSYPAKPAEGESRSILTIVLRSNERGQGWEPGLPKLVLYFYGIDQLKLEASSFLHIRLEITSIRDRQWCDIHYEVHEEEDQDLRFFCDTFDAALVSEADEEPSV